ncbi:BolA family protein [Ignatzschineria larvae DSM 13226]|uniref:BolA family protein n=1 Tax=Ignatzschineria larvae DSM 13226 TaxID=1111732 RepID=A0ABZ3BXW3_9GAMM|nr:BolA family protein [Ignatzschineria larvae]
MNNQAKLDKIKSLLMDSLSPSYLEVIDDSHLHIGHAGARGGGGHFTVKIASPKLEGLTLIKQHRLIYQALDTMMQEEIHALSIQIMTQKP